MTPEAIYAAAVDYIGYDGAIVPYTLARWAAYPDPAEIPPGWTDRGGWTGPTGIQQMASDPTGRLFRDAPARRIPWTCPAGVSHGRYWRSLHHPNRAPLVACEHQPSAIEIRPWLYKRKTPRP
jgi:hypothetical protein